MILRSSMTLKKPIYKVRPWSGPVAGSLLNPTLASKIKEFRPSWQAANTFFAI